MCFFLKICIPCPLDGSILLIYAELSEFVLIMILSDTAICYLRNTFCSLAMGRVRELKKKSAFQDSCTEVPIAPFQLSIERETSHQVVNHSFQNPAETLHVSAFGPSQHSTLLTLARKVGMD